MNVLHSHMNIHDHFHQRPQRFLLMTRINATFVWQSVILPCRALTSYCTFAQNLSTTSQLPSRVLRYIVDETRPMDTVDFAEKIRPYTYDAKVGKLLLHVLTYAPPKLAAKPTPGNRDCNRTVTKGLEAKNYLISSPAPIDLPSDEVVSDETPNDSSLASSTKRGRLTSLLTKIDSLKEIFATAKRPIQYKPL